MAGAFGALMCLLAADLLAADLNSGPASDIFPGAVGLQSGITFSAYSPLSRSDELARRLLSPLQAERVEQQLRRSASAFREQPVDLAHERFTLYVPARCPTGGYALLVFVPPSDNAAVPPGWKPVLDRQGMIFVAAEHSGNSADISARREALAILAAANVMARYRVDPDHVYVAGFSGGSRIALRLAVAYPDLFHGALLNAGSDPIGEPQFALPPSDLFSKFQESSRVFYLSGENDPTNVDSDAGSVASMRAWCVFNVQAETAPHIGHELANPGSIERAIAALSKPVDFEPERLRSCRQRIQQEMQQQLDRVELSLSGNDFGAAESSLRMIDTRYGGLAAPRILELERTLDESRDKRR